MKYLFTLLLFNVLSLVPEASKAQAFMGFENRVTTLNSTSVSGQYIDLGSSTVAHQLQDYMVGGVNVPVSSPTSPGVLGFKSFFTPSRSGAASSTEGLTEGDVFGYATGSAVSSSVTQPPTEGVNAFMLEDTDGMVTLEFSPVDLLNQGGVLFSMDFILDGTFEFDNGANDRLYIAIEVSDCAAAGTVPFFDSDGGGSGGSGAAGNDLDNATYRGTPILDDTWYTITEDLTDYAACKVQLIIEADFNSTTEEAAIDNIRFSQGVTLPVEFMEITATAREKAVDLYWATATETENRGFSIERSMDAINFQPIGWMDGNGNSSEQINYTFEDQNITAGQQYYYRLRQEDFSGAYAYSSIVNVQTAGAPENTVGRLFPNPAKSGMANLELFAEQSADWQITILDLSGRVLSENTQAVTEGFNLVPINLQKQPGGTYLVRVVGEGTTQLRRIVR